jgi:dihydroorotase
VEHYDLILRNGVVVSDSGQKRADVGVRAGRIAGVGHLGNATAAEEIECSGLHVLPGLIDPHVHLRDPGDPTVENFSDGTRGAV